MTPHASPWITFGIGGLALSVAALVLIALWRAGGRASVAIGALWVIAAAALASSGALADFDARPPRFLWVLGPTLALPVALALSPLGRRLSAAAPLWALVAFHAFRLPLELVMHQAAREGVMPPQMTFGVGLNYDIVTGASALVVAALLAWRGPSRAVALAFNALGSALLLVIVAIALASLPAFARFGRDALNTWVAYFPFVWLPAVLVSSALLGHLLLWRRLLERGAPL